jgi:hypothetical protein
MRDKPRTLAKPPGTRRIAMVGSSIVMGLGVDDDHTITQELERRLNASSGPSEVLNFGMGRLYAVERRAMVEHKVLAFDPDLILYVAHQDELFHSGKNLGMAYARGISFDDPELERLFVDNGLSKESSLYDMQSFMSTNVKTILDITYRHLSSIGREARVPVVFVYLPIPGNHPVPSDPKVVVDMASKAGLQAIDLSDWWGNHLMKEVVGVIDEYHPRELGTQLIAQALAHALAKQPSVAGR